MRYAEALDAKMTKKATKAGEALVLHEVLSAKAVRTLMGQGWEMVGQLAHAPLGGTSLFTRYTLRKRLDTAA